MTHKPASSLVMVVLTMAVISVVLLAGSSALLSSIRQRSALESGVIAEQMAQTALQEGLLRLQGGTTEYGVGSGTLALTPRTRGFVGGTACEDFIADVGTPQASQLPAFDSKCARYELALRSFVTMGANEDYTYTSQDLPTATTIEIPIRTSGLSFSVFQPVSGLSYQLCKADGSCAGGSTAVGFQVNDADITKVVISDVAYTTPPTSPQNVMTVSSITDTPFSVGKGFQTIEATGIAPDGTEYRLLTIKRPSGTVTAQTSQIFMDNGICQPSAAACR